MNYYGGFYLPGMWKKWFGNGIVYFLLNLSNQTSQSLQSTIPSPMAQSYQQKISKNNSSEFEPNFQISENSSYFLQMCSFQKFLYKNPQNLVRLAPTRFFRSFSKFWNNYWVKNSQIFLYRIKPCHFGTLFNSPPSLTGHFGVPLAPPNIKLAKFYCYFLSPNSLKYYPYFYKRPIWVHIFN